MGPKGFWIALAIVLLYLIARPRLSTVWYVNADGARLTKEGSWNALGATSPSPSPPATAFPNRQDCYNAEGGYEYAVGVTGLECRSQYALLWGW